MRHLLLVFAIALALGSNDASAQHRHYHGHSNGGWAAPLVGGLIVGGIIGSLASQPPRYAYPPVVAQPYSYQPVCYRRHVGYDYYGYPVYRTFCE